MICIVLGEAMEQALRDSCRSIRIGKILIQSDDETSRAKVFYAKLPKDISKRTVLLMYPILCKYPGVETLVPLSTSSPLLYFGKVWKYCIAIILVRRNALEGVESKTLSNFFLAESKSEDEKCDRLLE